MDSCSRVLCALLFLAAAAPGPVRSADTASVPTLADQLQPFAAALSGERERFKLRAEIAVPIDSQRHNIIVRFFRLDGESFDLQVTHADYAVHLRRRANVTEMALPRHGVVFVGTGDVDPRDHLAPRDFVSRVSTPRSAVSQYIPAIFQPDAQATAGLLQNILGVSFDGITGRGAAGRSVSFRFIQPGELSLAAGEIEATVTVSETPQEPASLTDLADSRVIKIERGELERTLVRGLRRACEILQPSRLLTSPPQIPRRVPHGELRWVDGQRVVLLSGTPEQIGRAHGELLKAEAQACIDSVLHTFGIVQTVRTGRWFRHDLDAAFRQLEPHIPQRHRAETRAMAAALGLDNRRVQALNVFPELFHCSGFALFGRATRDGRLYHGRVLDYMTTIGLQDAATTFIVDVEGRIPFANVGYAGFTGSVSGMNAQAISLGEMGGRGEGQWDGVPMATLMRRALEECTTVQEVMTLWKTSPRTCEYYYVFADGKSNQAVGVAATPDSIEFVHPGQSHERLGEGIDDAVVLSAGSRLQKLRERVQARYGEFDATLGQWLMSRPVAMESNLHNVLFVPQDGIFFVSNADHIRPAAERPYVRFNLRELLESMDRLRESAAATASERN